MTEHDEALAGIRQALEALEALEALQDPATQELLAFAERSEAKERLRYLQRLLTKVAGREG